MDAAVLRGRQGRPGLQEGLLARQYGGPALRDGPQDVAPGQKAVVGDSQLYHAAAAGPGHTAAPAPRRRRAAARTAGLPGDCHSLMAPVLRR